MNEWEAEGAGEEEADTSPSERLCPLFRSRGLERTAAPTPKPCGPDLMPGEVVGRLAWGVGVGVGSLGLCWSVVFGGHQGGFPPSTTSP